MEKQRGTPNQPTQHPQPLLSPGRCPKHPGQGSKRGHLARGGPPAAAQAVQEPGLSSRPGPIPQHSRGKGRDDPDPCSLCSEPAGARAAFPPAGRGELRQRQGQRPAPRGAPPGPALPRLTCKGARQPLSLRRSVAGQRLPPASPPRAASSSSSSSPACSLLPFLFLLLLRASRCHSLSRLPQGHGGARPLPAAPNKDKSRRGEMETGSRKGVEYDNGARQTGEQGDASPHGV